MENKEIKKLLKNQNLKEEDLNFYWKYCKVFNQTSISQLDAVDWRELTYEQASKLKNQFTRLSNKLKN